MVTPTPKGLYSSGLPEEEAEPTSKGRTGVKLRRGEWLPDPGVQDAVIKSAASAASPGGPGRRLGMLTAGTGRSPSRRGGCASSRLDHGLSVFWERLLGALALADSSRNAGEDITSLLQLQQTDTHWSPDIPIGIPI